MSYYIETLITLFILLIIVSVMLSVVTLSIISKVKNVHLVSNVQCNRSNIAILLCQAL